MLFNSYEFIFLFLPITLLGFFCIANFSNYRVALAWLVIASLFFYGWWNPSYLTLLLGSIIFNYLIGIALDYSATQKTFRRTVLIVGISFNLLLIGYYKYADFFVENISRATGNSFDLGAIALPLGISFFTFQQITYLIDAYKGEAKGYSFVQYCLFVTFFPQLIAGPIVHHGEVLPQFTNKKTYQLDYENLAVGLIIFFLGLFKKVVFADSIAVFATPVFSAAEQGTTVTFLEAWGGVLAYTLQIYFDFSGYSDMAVGLGRLFGIRLPINFNSPYKATSISDFWRRWHITLSNFLRDYLYIPLGGNRKGEFRRYLNLMITMLLGGLWHGAGWTFVIWGGLHGFYLVINHAWQRMCRRLQQNSRHSTWWGTGLARTLTFLSVAVAWVFFRAETLNGATNLLRAMIGQNGIVLPQTFKGIFAGIANRYGFIEIGGKDLPVFGPSVGFVLIIFLLGIAFTMPNTMQIMSQYKPTLESDTEEISPSSKFKLPLQFSFSSAFMLSCIIIVCLLAMQTVQKSEFLYFDF